jgi:hypothetical protein
VASPYESKNIYNEDEAGLFFREIPIKSLRLRDKSVLGCKMSKGTLPVLLCGNGKASRNWKISKTKMIQEPEN